MTEDIRLASAWSELCELHTYVESSRLATPHTSRQQNDEAAYFCLSEDKSQQLFNQIFWASRNLYPDSAFWPP